MAVSLAQIAKQAGVSTAAVSKALRDHADISPATRHRIKVLARELGYRGNFAARVLATHRTTTIGVLVTFPHIPTVIERVRGAQQAAQEAGYATAIAFHSGSEQDEINQLCMLQDRVDGVIVTVSTPGELLADCLRKYSKPVVCMCESVPGLDTDFVGGDDIEGGRLVGRHLAQLGRFPIAYLGENPSTSSDLLILQGMQEVLMPYNQGIQDSNLRWNNESEEMTRENITSLMDGPSPPGALVAFSDLTAMWCLRKLRQLGLRVPEDIAVVGYDDISFASLAVVPLTSVSEPNYDIGYQAAGLLLERLQGGKREQNLPARKVMFPTKLIVRESTGFSGKDKSRNFVTG